VGSYVAQELAAAGWTVSVIDDASESFDRLDPGFPGETFEGHALDQDLLRAAGIERAEACVVATSGDNTNLTAAQVVKRKFGTDRVVVRVLDPRRAEFYANFGLEVVCPTAAAIEQLTAAVTKEPAP
jgi:trk system potassium uptake protein TrkA